MMKLSITTRIFEKFNYLSDFFCHRYMWFLALLNNNLGTEITAIRGNLKKEER